ncbi:hypothetical protein MA9V1_111 [Chryseobacterium phage MA9V-1]|nr:hypothetical protein MA9V1_111 [Chryseobacterium phage MA9V-1]
MALKDIVANSFAKQESSIGAAVNGVYADLTEPTYLVFEPIFNFNMPTGLLADESNVNSALAFLKRNGEMARYTQLKNAIASLKIMLQQSPWIFESVTGFSDAMSYEMDAPEITDGKIEMTLHETLDMRVSNFIHTMQQVIYDYNVRIVEILPRNLQEFSMGILIHELRFFQDTNQVASKMLKQFDVNGDAQAVMSSNHFLLHFGKCRILRTSGNNMFKEFSNEDIPAVKMNLDIEYKTFVQTHNFNTLAEYDVTGQADQVKVETAQDKVQQLSDKLSAAVGTSKVGLVGSNIFGNAANVVGNQFNLNSYSAAGISMDSVKAKLANAYDVAEGIAINSASRYAEQLANKGVHELKNIFGDVTQEVAGFLPKRLTTNIFFQGMLGQFEDLKNPKIWDIIDTLASDTHVNKRGTYNIYRQ